MTCCNEPREAVPSGCCDHMVSELLMFLQLSFSPSTPMNSHLRVMCLLVSLLLDCCGLAVVCGLLGASYGAHTLSFMAAEVRAAHTHTHTMLMLFVDDAGVSSCSRPQCLLVTVRTGHVIMR